MDMARPLDANDNTTKSVVVKIIILDVIIIIIIILKIQKGEWGEDEIN